MAHNIEFFCHLEGDPAKLMDDVRRVAEQFGVPVESGRTGVGWHSVELVTSDSGAAIIEIHLEDEATRAAVQFAEEHLDDPSLLQDVNGIVGMILSGDVSDDLLQAVIDLFEGSCRVVGDDISGFVPHAAQ